MPMLQVTPLLLINTVTLKSTEGNESLYEENGAGRWEEDGGKTWGGGGGRGGINLLRPRLLGSSVV